MVRIDFLAGSCGRSLYSAADEIAVALSNFSSSYSRVFLAISMYADYAIGLRSCSLMITACVNKVNILDNLMLGEEVLSRYLVCELIDRARDHFLQRVLRWRL